MDNTSPDSDACAKLAEKTKTTDWDKLYRDGKTMFHFSVAWSTDRIEAKTLQMLVYMARAERVLEVGMFVGYATMQMAECLPHYGKIVTCEVDPFLKGFAQPIFDSSEHGKKIQVKVGPAVDTITQIDPSEKFDLVFIDADKGNYGRYYDLVLDRGLLAKGGVIVVDNTFFKGQAYLPPSYTKPDIYNWNSAGSAIRQFNEKVAEDPRVENVMLPVRDGITIIRMAGSPNEGRHQ